MPPAEREKYEERARERAKEQEMAVMNPMINGDVPVPVQRIINHPMTMPMNGYHPPITAAAAAQPPLLAQAQPMISSKIDVFGIE